MPDKYLLPCECGQSVTIGISEAGKEVSCTCGRKMVVPSLRMIRQLKPASDAPMPKGPAWNPVKGFIFAAGALLAIGGMIVAGHSYFIYSRVVEYQPSSEMLTESLKMIETMDPVELWEAWHFVKDHGLEEAGTSDFAQAKSIAESKLQQSYIGATAAAIGLLLALISFFLPASR
jgi:hypothetical protein